MLGKNVKTIQISMMVFFSILLVLDYFPDHPLWSSIPTKVVIFGILGLILIGLVLSVNAQQDDRSVFKWQLGLLVYMLTFMAILTLFGGESSIGLSFDNYAVWVAVGIGLIEILSRWRKIKKAENTARNG